PLQFFDAYLQYGYYPFFSENLSLYHQQLNRVIRLIIESDLHFIEGITLENVRKIYRLLYILAANVPFKPNITKLSERIGIHRNTLIRYLYYLEKARLLNLLSVKGKSISTLSKPDKVYLENTNIAYALASKQADQGTLRETFLLNQIKNVGEISMPKNGDFIADDIETGVFNKIPLWLFGFLY
ncbi:MAG: AAA family ATPase, partial [Flavobacteriales bacterium]